MTPEPPHGSPDPGAADAEAEAADAETDTGTTASDAPEAPHRHLAHSWQEARQLAFDCAAPIPSAPVPLRHALGRTLAEDVTALHDMPHYASSAMDGWAVSGSGPWILAEPGQRLAPHQASPIVTGGLIPPGAKAVLRSESGVIAPDEDGLPVLKLGGGAKPGEPRNGDHIRKAAEEAAAGELLIKAGAVLNPAQLALAALAGHDALPVLGKAVVRLVFTGAEVVSTGVPAPGEVRDTFGPQLAAVVEMLGGICAGETKIGDSDADWLAALEDTEPPAAGHDPQATPGNGPDDPGEALPADVVITTGGTGRSGTDHLRRTVAELGGRYAEIGHAERRRIFGEDDRTIGLKTAAAYRNGLTPVLCVGESQQGSVQEAIRQCTAEIDAALNRARSLAPAGRTIVAYEPQWAIGAQQPATPEYISAVITGLDAHLRGLPGQAESRVIYGGSAGPGLIGQLDDAVAGLFLGRFAHDPQALNTILDETAARLGLLQAAGVRP